MIDRERSHTRATYALQLFESVGIKTINNYKIASICGDKVTTSALLQQNGVPTLDIKVAFTKESALEAVESMGYPVVLKPVVGSWGRLLARINDRDSAEAILEHKEYLPSTQSSIYYLQELINRHKGGLVIPHGRRGFPFKRLNLSAEQKKKRREIYKASQNASKLSCR